MTHNQHYDSRIFRPILCFLYEVRGPEALARVGRKTGLTFGRDGFESSWTSVEEADVFLNAVRDECDSDEEFRRAAAYRLKDISVLARPLLGIASVLGTFKGITALVSRTSSIGSVETEVLDKKRRAIIRYRASIQECRNMCIFRQGIAEAIPTFWGAGLATVVEHSCQSLGDECCEYHYELPPTNSYIALLVTSVVYASVAALVAHFGFSIETISAVGLGLIVCFSTLSIGLFRYMNAQSAHVDEIQQELRELFEVENHARRELQRLRERDAEWSHEIDVQVSENEAMRARLGSMIQIQNKNARGLSHDMRSPLGVIRFASCQLLNEECLAGGNAREMLELQVEATNRLENMLEEFMRGPEIKNHALPTVVLSVSDLATTLESRAKAFSQGKPIDVELRRDSSTPEAVETQLMLFDRIVDNLLSNAARYTERGKIDIRLQGEGDFLIIMIRDSGCGIERSRLRAALLGDRGVEPDERVAGSIGIGLSVVVRLLKQLGGRLEVATIEDIGTAWWIYLPISLGENRRVYAQSNAPPVVHIQTGTHRPVELTSRPLRRPNGGPVSEPSRRH